MRNGLNCRVARVEEITGNFDVICLWDLIEHVTEPREFLTQVRRLSHVGTQLFIQIPRYGHRFFEFVATARDKYKTHEEEICATIGRSRQVHFARPEVEFPGSLEPGNMNSL